MLHPRAPCGGIIPPHPQAIALLPPAPVLSRNGAEKFLLAGYYTPTPPLRGCYTLALPVGELFPHTPKLLLCCLLPLFCQGIAPKICCGGIIPPHPLCEGVTPSRSHTYLFVARSNICFVKELRRKNLRGKARKIFRALDNGGKLKIKTRAEQSHAPRLNCLINFPRSSRGISTFFT